MGVSAEFVQMLRGRLAATSVVERDRAAWLIADSVGIGLAAARISPVAQQAIAAASLGARGVCSVWGGRREAPPLAAAFGNAVLAHALDLDDVCDEAGVHSTTVVLPAALAAGELVGASGQDVLDGLIAGTETVVRFGRAARTAGQRSYLWFLTQLAGSFGAAIAAGVAMRLDDTQLESAIGLALSQAAGAKEPSAGVGSTARTIYPGFAVQGGLQSALLAAGGLIGPATVLEGRTGLWRSYFDEPLGDAAFAELIDDRDEALEDVAVKTWPCCRITHRYIDAVLGMPAFTVDEIERIEISVDAEAAPLCFPLEIRRYPENVSDAAFSIPFMTASALTRRRVDLVTMREDLLHDPDVLRLVEAIEPEDVEERGESPRLARVTVITRDGAVRGVGGGDLRPTETQGREKLDDVLAAAGYAESGEALWRLAHGLSEMSAREFLDGVRTIAAG